MFTLLAVGDPATPSRFEKKLEESEGHSPDATKEAAMSELHSP